MGKVQLKNIYKEYNGKEVLKNININIKSGELVALLGSSGSGKTTILHGITGIIHFDKGNIIINNEIIDNVAIEKRGSVLVDQNLLLFPHMTVESNIAFGMRIKKISKSIIKEKVADLIKLLELIGHEKKYPNQLSGGQMQRVALARALAIEPSVLLLDEPFSKLDISLRKNMQFFVKNLQKKLNMTTLLVTHDKEEALSMADKVALLIDGEIKQFSTPREIYEKPISRQVSDFFGKRNYISGKIIDGKFISKLGIFKTNVKDSSSITFMFRPEEIHFGDKKEGSVVGTVKSRIYSGDKINYTIKVLDEEIYCSTQNNIQIDKEVYINLDFNDRVYFS